MFSIPFWIQTSWLSPMAFVDYAFATVTGGSHYHLWYLLYLLYSLPLAYILLRLVPAKRQWMLILMGDCDFYLYIQILFADRYRAVTWVAEPFFQTPNSASADFAWSSGRQRKREREMRRAALCS